MMKNNVILVLAKLWESESWLVMECELVLQSGGSLTVAIQKLSNSQVLWVTPVILATREAEIRRIKVQSQAGELVQETISKTPNTKKCWLKRVAQAVKRACLAKHEDLSWNTSTVKNKTKPLKHVNFHLFIHVLSPYSVLSIGILF
jgi:hypothetical protein